MKYSSAPAFRQALEDRLRSENSPQKLPRLRKMIAFERFMARLDNRWILKGGYALQLRTEKARTTQDVDLLALEITEDQIAETLLEAAHRDSGDYFEFFVERSDLNLDEGSAIRFRVTSRVAGRVFERFHIDIGYGDPIVEAIEFLTPPNYLAFAEVASPAIPCTPQTQSAALSKQLTARRGGAGPGARKRARRLPALGPWALPSHSRHPRATSG